MLAYQEDSLLRDRTISQYQVLDTRPELAFDELTELASAICEAPISLISLLDGSRQWFKSAHGLAASETPIELSFCVHATQQPNELLIVEDATRDARFRENDLVTGDPSIRAYAGAALVSPEGVPFGALCVIDDHARDFTPFQRRSLQIIRDQVVEKLNLRRQAREHELAYVRLHAINAQLDQLTYVIAHDLKATLRHQNSFAQIILEDSGPELSREVHQNLKHIIESGDKAQELLVDLNDYVTAAQSAYGKEEEFIVEHVIRKLPALDAAGDSLAVHLPQGQTSVRGRLAATRRILQDLVCNAIEYNDSPHGNVWIEVDKRAEYILIDVIDDGLGVEARDRKRIFEAFQRGVNTGVDPDKKGMGLTISLRLAESMGGGISLVPTDRRGAFFRVRLPHL